MQSPILNTKQGGYCPCSGQDEEGKRKKRNLVASLLLPALPTCSFQGQHQHPLPLGSVVCQGDAGTGYRARFVCWLLWKLQKEQEVSGIWWGLCETSHATASIPHQAGLGPSGADLEWGSLQCAHCCSELQNGGHSFHPEESQGGGDNYTMISGPPPPALWAESFCPGVMHTYLILGSLVCSSSNQHKHDLEASRPGCKVNYCQAMLPQEERRKESITWLSHNT